MEGQVDSESISVGKAALGNLLGGIGYFYWQSITTIPRTLNNVATLHSSCFILVLTIRPVLTPLKNNGERFHTSQKSFSLFDMAYQEFSSGDLEKDVAALRIFIKDRHLVGLAQSFAKNMGLFGHKVGCLRKFK
ncbi:hypothetical protein PIB30_043619 [Stylosanthes scabra]|uniref:Aspartate transaminase n=1 Tax=Stylosanthes scabra TaxID=79078 RepID=A0ABU6VH22_9FABA|nr:hypothetical protein [Stylosanthes scabra]